MNRVVFDIETSNIFADVGKRDPALLDISIVGLYDYASDSYKTFSQEEFPQMWPILERADLLIGFNSEHFDLPLLNKYYQGDLNNIRHLDLLKEIRNVAGRRMKLDQLAEGSLGSKKSGHGIEATVWWKKGEHQKVRDYCIDDVKITKDLYEYAIKNKMVKFKEDGKNNVIKLDISSWQEPVEKNALTFSLPFS